MFDQPLWWIVLLAGEYAETSSIYGPFRSEQAAEGVAERWNAEHPSDPATVMPVEPASQMR